MPLQASHGRITGALLRRSCSGSPLDCGAVAAVAPTAGRPDEAAAAAASLRYKKKMMGWTWPAVQPQTHAAEPSAQPAHGAAAALVAEDRAEEEAGVIGYSLMTFVLRNGLAALRQVP